ncbi:hypothetical protein ACFLS4_03280 [Bacteroidota bacterium]
MKNIRNLLSFALLAILLLVLSKSMTANDSLGIALNDILFFESGKDIPSKQDRVYMKHFKPETRFINVEFNVKNLKYDIEDQEFKITFVWKYLNGMETGRADGIFNIKSDWESSYISRSWGWPDKGNWRLGRFTVQVLINDVLFAEKDFFINPDDYDFYTFSKENKTIENLHNLPEDINYQVLQQYKTDLFFANYYKIEFSENCQDISYKLSNYEQYETYNSVGNKITTTTRNVYLFKNNKQIVPVYFRIDAFFDNDMKNLAYTGAKTTSTTFNDIYCYYNGRQLFKSIYLPDFYISPDSKKYTYIWNSMPRMKSSFTWDSAYEYLMINSQKVQPEPIADAQTINITQPIVYVKNQDNTFNAVYTARYKMDKDYSFALFSETERISPLFNGDIGIPHLSADMSKVAYTVNHDKEWFVMINNKKITKGYDKIKDEIVFCESGNNIIYQAKIKGDWYVIKGDEIISDGFSKIESITINSNENSIAYKAKSGKIWNVYINKQKISDDYEEIGEEIILSTDGNQVAYVAATEENMFVMMNNKHISSNFELSRQYSAYIGKAPLAITNLIFNKTADKVAYLVNYAFAEGDLIAHNEQYFVMINDIQVSPKMYGASLISKNVGELFYAGIDISDLILHHVKIGF